MQGRGLRGVRVGEAANPGPPCRSRRRGAPDLKVWSHNMSSWRAHAGDLMMEATANNVDVVLLQETNLSQQAAPAASVMAKMKGWQLLHVPRAGTGKGGVSMLVREPWVATALGRTALRRGAFSLPKFLGHPGLLLLLVCIASLLLPGSSFIAWRMSCVRLGGDSPSRDIFWRFTQCRKLFSGERPLRPQPASCGPLGQLV